MTKVYRLETKTGTLEEGDNGAYMGKPFGDRSDSLADLLIVDSLLSSSNHPIPEEDPLLRNTVINQYARFAFISIDSLKDWFYLDEEKVEEVRSLNIAKISVYGVEKEHLQIGEKQVIVYSNHMTLIEEIDF